MKTNSYIGILPSAARTTTQTIGDFENLNCRGIKVVVVTTASSSPSNVVTIDYLDKASGAYQTLLTSAAITGNGTKILTVYPGLTADTNVTVSDCVPDTWRIKVTAGNSNSATYSVGAFLLT